MTDIALDRRYINQLEPISGVFLSKRERFSTRHEVLNVTPDNVGSPSLTHSGPGGTAEEIIDVLACSVEPVL